MIFGLGEGFYFLAGDNGACVDSCVAHRHLELLWRPPVYKTLTLRELCSGTCSSDSQLELMAAIKSIVEPGYTDLAPRARSNAIKIHARLGLEGTDPGGLQVRRRLWEVVGIRHMKD